MSDTYTKLFRSITASTIVSEPLATRWLWVTMLSQTDSSGCVWGSVPGLARIANITMEECEAALLCFLSPDPHSRTKENEGRRIEEIPRGWRLLNHALYDNLRSADERAEYKREWDRENRGNRPNAAARNETPDNPRHTPDTPPTTPDEIRQTPNTPTPLALALTPTEDQKHVRQGARFGEFWNLYPSHVGRKPCEQKWKARNLDHVADVILADVRRRIANDPKWRAGYVPNPMTYINQDRWTDGDANGAVRGPQSAEAPSATDVDFLHAGVH